MELDADLHSRYGNVKHYSNWAVISAGKEENRKKGTDNLLRQGKHTNKYKQWKKHFYP